VTYTPKSRQHHELPGRNCDIKWDFPSLVKHTTELSKLVCVFVTDSCSLLFKMSYKIAVYADSRLTSFVKERKCIVIPNWNQSNIYISYQI